MVHKCVFCTSNLSVLNVSSGKRNVHGALHHQPIYSPGNRSADVHAGIQGLTLKTAIPSGCGVVDRKIGLLVQERSPPAVHLKQVHPIKGRAWINRDAVVDAVAIGTKRIGQEEVSHQTHF